MESINTNDEQWLINQIQQEHANGHRLHLIFATSLQIINDIYLYQQMQTQMQVKILKMRETVRLPRKGTNDAAGFDLCSNDLENIVINPGEKKFIHTGLKMEMPRGYAGFIYARSGLGCKFGVVPSNCVGVIDSDYRGEVMVCLHNHGTEDFEVRYQYNIAQIVFMPVPEVEIVEVNDENELTDTLRDEGGFGSTGK